MHNEWGFGEKHGAWNNLHKNKKRTVCKLCFKIISIKIAIHHIILINIIYASTFLNGVNPYWNQTMKKFEMK